MIFRFEKRSSNNWWHWNGTTQILNFSNWEIVFDEVSQSVNLQQLNGANVPITQVPIADVRVKNLSGSDETFVTVALLRERLVALGYNPLVDVGGGTSQNLAEVLAIGGRTIKRVTSTAYEFVATDKSEYLVIDGAADDVVLTLDDSLFDDGDTIIGVGGVESFSLTIDNPIGDINPIDTASFTINYLDEFTITKIGASTWILTITNYASNQSGGGASWGSITGTLSAQTDLNTALSARLEKANNLSDLPSASTARTNLGLGTLATQNGTFSGASSGTNTGDQDLSLLALKTQVINNAHVYCQHTAQTLADSNSYFFGVLSASPATATFQTRRFNSPLTGKIIEVYAQTNSATPTSSQDVSLRINNKTTAVNNTIGNIRYDNVAFAFAFTGLSIDVVKGDNLECEIQVPVLTTNGTGSITGIQIIFEKTI